MTSSRSWPFVLGTLLLALAIIGLDYLACVAGFHYQTGEFFTYATQYQEHCTLFRGPLFIYMLSFLAPLWGVLQGAYTEIIALSMLGLLIVAASLASDTRRLWTEAVRSAETAHDTAARQARDTQAALALAKCSADAAALNAEIAHQSLYLLHRPYVVRGDTVDCGVELFMHGKSDATIGCTFVNHGLTHAILRELYIDLKLVAAGALPPVIDPRVVRGETYPPSDLIPPHLPQRFDIQIGKFVQLTDVRTGLMAQKSSLFLYGFIRYRDIFGKQYRHGFCGRYEALTNDFVVFGGAEYNYCDEDSADAMPVASRPIVAANDPAALVRERLN